MVQKECDNVQKNISEVRKFISAAKKTIIDSWDILVNIGIENPLPTEKIEQFLAQKITKQELAKQFLFMENATEKRKILPKHTKYMFPHTELL